MVVRPSAAMVRVEKLSKSFGGLEVLRDMDLEADDRAPHADRAAEWALRWADINGE
jgi:hypothetical protein